MPRLLTLDAMRGLAAVAVILFHLDFIAPFAPGGYLAVDFFFLMSGVVIARAYQARLDQGLPLAGFLVERIVRLYPLYLLGFLIGLLRRIGQIATHHPLQMSWPDLAVSALFNLVLLPSPVTDELAPINGPSWSLFLELVVNAVWAGVLVQVSQRALGAYVVAIGLALCGAVVASGGAHGGYAWSGLHVGLLRAFFGFGLGVLLTRTWRPRRPRASMLSLVAAAALCAVLASDIAPAWRLGFDLAAILVAFPAIVALGVAFDPPVALQRAATALGDLSYPVYMLHLGPLFSGAYLARFLGIGPVVWVPLFVLGICAVSLALARSYDPAARRLMKRLVAARAVKTSPANPAH